MQAYRPMGCHTHTLFANCLHRSSEQPIQIVITSEACLKVHLTNQALICVGVTNTR